VFIARRASCGGVQRLRGRIKRNVTHLLLDEYGKSDPLLYPNECHVSPYFPKIKKRVTIVNKNNTMFGLRRKRRRKTQTESAQRT
jgi:hypothetical protein